MNTLSVLDAVILGVVEGITEYLPVSSTGHLLVVQRLLGLGQGADKVAADTYVVAIQLGAILAVVALYRARITSMAKGLLGRDREGRHVFAMLAASFLPAAVIGVSLGGTIKDRLFTPGPVVVAWVVGGLFLLWWKPRAGLIRIEHVTLRNAVLIGLAQSVALWPGVSRSLVTIVAALLVGCTMAAALEYSFLLGLATLSAATVLDLAKDGDVLFDTYGTVRPLIGVLAAFVTAVVAVRWLVSYLSRHPLSIFGWYRLVAAGITLALWSSL